MRTLRMQGIDSRSSKVLRCPEFLSFRDGRSVTHAVVRRPIALECGEREVALIVSRERAGREENPKPVSKVG